MIFSAAFKQGQYLGYSQNMNLFLQCKFSDYFCFVNTSIIIYKAVFLIIWFLLFINGNLLTSSESEEMYAEYLCAGLLSGLRTKFWEGTDHTECNIFYFVNKVFMRTSWSLSSAYLISTVNSETYQYISSYPFTLNSVCIVINSWNNLILF